MTNHRLKRVGLIINPMAGMGGRVGLKGSDGKRIQDQARRLGAVPIAQERTLEALVLLQALEGKLEFTTYPAEMGADTLQAAGLPMNMIGEIQSGQTTALDTVKAARDLQAWGVELLLFAGGDGTARDICTAIGTNLPAIGIPSGVKILSGAYTINPLAAGRLARAYLDGEIAELRKVEVIDLDEEAFRRGVVNSKLYGYLQMPYQRGLVQARKAPSRFSEDVAVQAIAQDVIDQMDDSSIYIIGPGTTTRPILTRLGLTKTLIGIDVVYRKALIAADANEAQLLELLERYPAFIVVTPIGGQGHIFGRGNQQLSPQVLRRVGKEHILVVSPIEKILTLDHRPLLVDTGDYELDRCLRGYIQVITGYQERLVYPVDC
jgi:predicted polyphosphate/ATP-dependent NAD kinase